MAPWNGPNYIQITRPILGLYPFGVIHKLHMYLSNLKIVALSALNKERRLKIYEWLWLELDRATKGHR